MWKEVGGTFLRLNQDVHRQGKEEEIIPYRCVALDDGVTLDIGDKDGS